MDIVTFFYKTLKFLVQSYIMFGSIVSFGQLMSRDILQFLKTAEKVLIQLTFQFSAFFCDAHFLTAYYDSWTNRNKTCMYALMNKKYKIESTKCSKFFLNRIEHTCNLFTAL